MLRNRIHRLLGAQHEVKLPQCSDLFGRKGLSFLEKLELPAPARRKPWRAWFTKVQRSTTCAAYPGGDQSWPPCGQRDRDIERFPSAQKLCGYAGLCPSTHSSGGKTFQCKPLRHCNKWLRWAFVEAAWVAIGCSAYFGDFYKHKRARLARSPASPSWPPRVSWVEFTWQFLTQRRAYTSLAKDPIPPKPACRAVRFSPTRTSSLPPTGRTSAKP